MLVRSEHRMRAECGGQSAYIKFATNAPPQFGLRFLINLDEIAKATAIFCFHFRTQFRHVFQATV